MVPRQFDQEPSLFTVDKQPERERLLFGKKQLKRQGQIHIVCVQKVSAI